MNCNRRLPDWGMVLTALFLAGNIFAAWTIAGSEGIWCWLLGATTLVIADAAWRVFRD